MAEGKIISLMIGGEYQVQHYPQEDKSNAIYLGVIDIPQITRECHIFEDKKSNSYLLVDGHWLDIQKDNLVTYKSISSFSIQRIPKSWEEIFIKIKELK